MDNMIRIVFMGTPEFAVPSLKILLDNGFIVTAVVTAPDKPGGRKGIIQSPVKLFAQEHGIPVLQPERLKDPVFLETLRSFNADLQVVVAFRMLPEVVWSMPRLGTMNLHGSLLPKYRGAAPINWAIIRGEKETGVTTFLLQHQIDTGDILDQERIAIGPNETAGELHDRMMVIGARLVLSSVKALASGRATPRPQVDVEASHAPKIFTETCQIDFQAPANQVHNFIRGLSPYPGAWTTVHEKVVKILRTQLSDASTTVHMPGEMWAEHRKKIFVCAKDGCLEILELQMEGKKRMSAQDFLNGHPKFPDAL